MSLSPSSEAMELLAGDALHLLARAPPLPYPNRRSCWVVVVAVAMAAVVLQREHGMGTSLA